jgi:hypothetical protein
MRIAMLWLRWSPIGATDRAYRGPPALLRRQAATRNAVEGGRFDVGKRLIKEFRFVNARFD